ncbi:MAG: hypothetical protein ACTHN5_19075 [Phycisphaerae bacterium]
MSEEMKEFEQVLGAYRPAATGLTRESVLFEAGRAVGRAEGRLEGRAGALAGVWRWRVVAVLAVFGALLVSFWSIQGRVLSIDGREKEGHGYVRAGGSAEKSAPVAEVRQGAGGGSAGARAGAEGGLTVDLAAVPFGRAGAPGSYMELRDRVLLLGMNGLPSMPEGAAGEKREKKSVEMPEGVPAWQWRAAGLSGGGRS